VAITGCGFESEQTASEPEFILAARRLVGTVVDGRYPDRMRRGYINNRRDPGIRPGSVVPEYHCHLPQDRIRELHILRGNEPRWVHSVQGWTWLICVRFQDRGRTRTYALFLKRGTIINARYAVQTDECDMQAYALFERMGGSELTPLH
jgi:hypothetical protein